MEKLSIHRHKKEITTQQVLTLCLVFFIVMNLIQLNSKKYFWSNRKERKADALAHGGEEGRKQAKTTSICNKS